MSRSAHTGVALLNFGEPADTLRCLASLEHSLDLDLDVVVVDNGPEDVAHHRLREAVGSRAETIASGENLGYAAGNNLALERLLGRGCELVWVLNPDTVVEPTTLPRLRDALDAVPDCGVVGPRIVHGDLPGRLWFDGGEVDHEIGSSGHTATDGTTRGGSAPLADVGYVTGASLLARRSLVEDIGLLPTDYFLYYEEVDWCVRAQRVGWRTMIERRARMAHHKRSSGELPQPYYVYYLTRNRYLFAERCLGVDGERALADLRHSFVTPWRAKVAELAPGWLSSFDELVAWAEDDARAGVAGRKDALTGYPAPSPEASRS